MGRTLVTLVYNRGGSAAEPPTLPTHRLSPHDIVALRPAAQRGGADGGALADVVAQGVVYRVTEHRVVVAVDELDDSATLDVPLRLDKLANKVRHFAALKTSTCAA